MRTVTITVEVDPTEYHECEDSDRGAVELVTEMLRNGADWPDTVKVACNQVSQEIAI